MQSNAKQCPANRYIVITAFNREQQRIFTLAILAQGSAAIDRRGASAARIPVLFMAGSSSDRIQLFENDINGNPDVPQIPPEVRESSGACSWWPKCWAVQGPPRPPGLPSLCGSAMQPGSGAGHSGRGALWISSSGSTTTPRSSPTPKTTSFNEGGVAKPHAMQM